MQFTRARVYFAAIVSSLALFGLTANANSQPTASQALDDWKIHDESRPQPKVVDPGYSYQELPAPAPSDAIVLFDGRDVSQWETGKGEPIKWKVENGCMEVVKNAGAIQTKKSFGDFQLHVEWCTPEVVKNKGQNRGNSGIFLMNMYEVQVLDSYQNQTYPDGQAAAMYGAYPPQVNASRPPGHWQKYDLVFFAPRFDQSGKLISPGRVTVFHNNVLVQHHMEYPGPTGHKVRPPYKAHADKLPLGLQDHGDPVRFRNIWIREL